MNRALFRSPIFLGLCFILFALKGLGGSFNSLFTSLNLGEYHGPIVGGTLGFLIILFCFRFRHSDDQKTRPKESVGQRALLLAVFTLLIIWGTVIRVRKIQAVPIDESRADMLVTIISQIEDFLNGRDPYIPYTTGQGRTLSRFYLPVLWLGYTPFYVLKTDIRYFNIISQIAALCLILSCFLRLGTYPGLSPPVSKGIFLGSIALFLFSKQKLADVIDIQTAWFWLFYSLVLWSESLGKKNLTFALIPLVIASRHPAVLLFLPFFLFLLLRDRPRFFKLVTLCLLVCPVLIFPFMKHAHYLSDGIIFYGVGLKSLDMNVTAMFYGLSSILQRLDVCGLQKPLQVSGLIFAFWIVAQRSKIDSLDALALGGIAYTTFILFVSSTPQYIWAEPILLVYFLVNSPQSVKI